MCSNFFNLCFNRLLFISKFLFFDTIIYCYLDILLENGRYVDRNVANKYFQQQSTVFLLLIFNNNESISILK